MRSHFFQKKNPLYQEDFGDFCIFAKVGEEAIPNPNSEYSRKRLVSTTISSTENILGNTYR